jgi:hypothetical protein
MSNLPTNIATPPVTPPPPQSVLDSTGCVVMERQSVAGKDLTGLTVEDKTLRLSEFRDLGFLKTVIRNCRFNHSRFERCYFRKAKIDTTTFLGCTFKDCNFDEAQFTNCVFDYAEFENCSITFEQLKNTLPQHDNKLRDLARNLRINAQNRGMGEEYRKFLNTELKASERFNWKKAFPREDFYKKHFNGFLERSSGLTEYARLKLESFIWGYGEVPSRVVFTGAAIIIVFAFVFNLWSDYIQNLPSGANFLDFLALSATTFVSGTYGSVILATLALRFVAVFERILGVVIFGFLIASLYRKISRR